MDKPTKICITLAIGHNDFTWESTDVTVRVRRDDETETEYIEKVTSGWLAKHDNDPKWRDVCFVTVYAYSDADED